MTQVLLLYAPHLPSLNEKNKNTNEYACLHPHPPRHALIAFCLLCLLHATTASLQLQQAGSGPDGPVALLSEEVVRGSAAATLSLLLTAVEPSLRRLAGVSAWSVISRLPDSVTGTLSQLTPCLSQLPAGGMREPTILLLQRLAGEQTEETDA